jgi:dipeptidyl aminopeptidase/acylaminoacyl peptidase
VGAPKTPGPLNPLSRDAGVLSETFYEQRLAVVGTDGGDISLLGPADLNVYEYDWSPDGRRFAITAAHGSGDDNWWIAELDVCDALTGAITTLLKPSMQMASPRYSGDGTRIAFIGGIMSDESITGGDIYVVPASGGTPEDITPGLAASVHTITWNGSPREIVATEFAAGEEVLARVEVVNKTQHELWRASEMIWANTLLDLTPGDAGISLSRNGAMTAVIRQSYNAPPEVETGPPGRWHAITHTNAAVRPITGKARNVHWKSDGVDVQGMLIEPMKVEPGKRYALIVEVHGGTRLCALPDLSVAAGPLRRARG